MAPSEFKTARGCGSTLGPCYKTVMKLDVRKATKDYALALYGPILIQLWQTGTPDEGARAARVLALELSRSQFPEVGTIAIVPADAGLPSADARDSLAHLPGDLGKATALALVREGDGFRASTIRAVLTGIMLVSRNNVPHQVFSATDSASSWLRERLEIPGGAAGLALAIGELRGRYSNAVAA